MLFRYHVAAEGHGLVELLHDDGTPSGVECLMSPLEPLVYDTVCAFLPDNTRAAEVGSFVGGSCCVVSHGMRRRGKRLDLFCHDLFEPFELNGTVVDINKRFDEGVARWGFSPTKVEGKSQDTAAIHPDASLDYCFVDGDHAYEGALADLASYAPKVKPDGWLVVQDCIDDVARAVQDSLLCDAGEWNAVMVQPPHGHYVLVCNRDAGLVDRFMKALDTVLSGRDPGAETHEFPATV